MKNLMKVVAWLLIFTTLAQATTLTGTLKRADGTTLNGTLYLKLMNSASQLSTGGCGGPAQIAGGPNSKEIPITVTNGVVSATILGYDCMQPTPIYYAIRFTDNNGSPIFTDSWLIGGASQDIGNLVSTQTVGIAFSGAVLLSPALNADQSIASNILPSGSRNLGSSPSPWTNGFFVTLNTSGGTNVGGNLAVTGTSAFTGTATFGNVLGTAGKTLSGFDALQSAVFKSTNGTLPATGTIQLGDTDSIRFKSGTTEQDIITFSGVAEQFGDASGSSTALGTWGFGNLTSFSSGITIAGDSMTSGARFYISHFFAGALNTTWTAGHELIPKAITIQRVHINTKAGPSGCSTNAVVRVSDGTTNIDTTITATSVDNNPGSVAMLAGATLTWSVQTASSGCGTNPSDANVVIQYKLN